MWSPSAFRGIFVLAKVSLGLVGVEASVSQRLQIDKVHRGKCSVRSTEIVHFSEGPLLLYTMLGPQETSPIRSLASALTVSRLQAIMNLDLTGHMYIHVVHASTSNTYKNTLPRMTSALLEIKK